MTRGLGAVPKFRLIIYLFIDVSVFKVSKGFLLLLLVFCIIMASQMFVYNGKITKITKSQKKFGEYKVFALRMVYKKSLNSEDWFITVESIGRNLKYLNE